MDSRVASVHLGDVEIPIVVTAPWDGSSGGSPAIHPRHSRAAACTFLKGYEVLRDVVNECLHPQPQIHADCPRILLSQYGDNIYIMFTAIPPIRVLLSVRPTPRGGGVWQNFRVGGCPTPPPPRGGVGLCGGPWVYRASATSFFLLLQVPCNMFIYGVFTWYCISRVHAPRP